MKEFTLKRGDLVRPYCGFHISGLENRSISHDPDPQQRWPTPNTPPVWVILLGRNSQNPRGTVAHVMGSGGYEIGEVFEWC